jgi:hypothetical protein
MTASLRPMVETRVVGKLESLFGNGDPEILESRNSGNCRNEAVMLRDGREGRVGEGRGGEGEGMLWAAWECGGL